MCGRLHQCWYGIYVMQTNDAEKSAALDEAGTGSAERRVVLWAAILLAKVWIILIVVVAPILKRHAPESAVWAQVEAAGMF